MMKPKMLISCILALLLVPYANSCDRDACRAGTSAGKGICQVGAGAAATKVGAACAGGPWTCLGAGLLAIGAATGCAIAGKAADNACDKCPSDNAPNFQEIAKKVDGFKIKRTIQGISNKLDGTEQNFQEIFKKLKGTDHKFKEIFKKLDGTEQNLEEITKKLNGFEQNFEEFKYKMDLQFRRITNKLNGIEQSLAENHLKQEAWYHQLVENDEKILQTQLENHLKQEAWFQQLVENDKNIILGQAKMIMLQQTTMSQLDQLINTSETLRDKIEDTQTIAAYAQDFKNVRHVRKSFQDLTRGSSGIIVNDYLVKLFRDVALDPRVGSMNSINNIFLMLHGGLIFKRKSIYQTRGDKYCKPEVHKYFVDVLVEALTMHATALAMEGHTLKPRLIKQFNLDIVKATSAFNRFCDCSPGYRKANRGQVSTLLARLPSSSHNLIQNRGLVARMENRVMRIKMDLILAVKNFEPNKIAESILESHSVEDIELVVASVKNKKEDDLELQDSADICVDKERNKVKTSAAFTPDSFVNGCVPPQTLEHGRFFCVEDGVTCHVVCDPGYTLEAHGSALVSQRFIKCLDNTWTPLPTSFKCEAPTCSSGATRLSTSPGRDMVLCKDKTESTCERDFETLCPVGWNLCTPGQFNNRNHGWDYNWKDANAGAPLGVIYCYGGGRGEAFQYMIWNNAVLNTDEPHNCWSHSSRPGCEAYGCGLFDWLDCDEKDSSALCCAPTRTCGDGVVQQEEDCDDGNDSNMDDCLNTCTWKYPGSELSDSACS